MNTRKTFNGRRYRRRYSLPTSILAAVVMILASITIAAWIGVIGLYASSSAQPGREAVREVSIKRDASQAGTFDRLAKNKVVISLKSAS